MKSNYTIIIVVTILLFALSIAIAITNYEISLKTANIKLKTQSLPLSTDNIYTEIQQHIIKPYLISSMMANDTFVKDWLNSEEKDREKIVKYLNNIKNEYEILTAFLVSQKTKNYYTQNGFLEKIDKAKKSNQWYFKFEKKSQDHEINPDYNDNIANSLIMFINFKIYDNAHNFLGVTGLAIEISYVDEMLRMFKKNYHLDVFFLNKDGDILLTKQGSTNPKHIDEMLELKKYKNSIISNTTNIFEYKEKGEDYFVKTKYIKELDSYLVVKANLKDFTTESTKVFYFNLVISLLFSLIFAFIIMLILRNYHKKLERLAEFDTLTQLPNRLNFTKQFNHFLALHKRDKRPISLAFMDIDNFKSINDKLGHNVGDEVLVQCGKILQNNIRKTDLLARWGGEEFIVAFIDTDINNAHTITQKIRKSIEENETLKKIVSGGVSASFGLSVSSEFDTIESIVSRADKAMYEAKQNGKNRVVLTRYESSEQFF
nr:sensor domain-containing diguanylate cyclase [uncultured Sulfurimonas sp.]